MKKVKHAGQNGFISRDLSWLDFNSRVLDEAAAPENPLLDKLKFIAIFSSNLDEFFMVRVASLLQMVKQGKDTPDPAGNRPSVQLREIRRKLNRLLARQRDLLSDILTELERSGIRLRHPDQLPEAAQKSLDHFFERQIAPVLTPLAVDPSHPFPMVNNGAVEIAISMLSGIRQEALRAFVRVPEVLPRFIPVQDGLPGKTFVTLEDLIMTHLETLFPGCQILEYFPFRITRDMEFPVDEAASGNLLDDISAKLTERRQGTPIRLELPADADPELEEWLKEQFHLSEDYCYRTRSFLHLKQFFELITLAEKPELQEPPWPPLPVTELPAGKSVFESIARHDPVMIVQPYQSFDPVVRLLESAAEDPDVLAVKQTLYRVSGNSPVVRALQRAAENGKQVTVIVELKARFDEGNNIAWAKRLEESGAHVVYGIRDLKIHCKALLVIRREEGLIKRYLHLSTGNYNDKTALQYTDVGILTTHPELCFDVATLFNVMTGCSEPPDRWNLIAASPFDLREKIMALIDREMRFCAAGKKGKITAKMNSLSDPEIIAKLHSAAESGVEIRLIVRGICCLQPLPGENIKIISIVDRYLEHARIFCFHNNGDAEYYLASADWMFRNMDRRIELFFPVLSEEHQQILQTILDLELSDDAKGRRLTSDGRYMRPAAAARKNRSQLQIYEFFDRRRRKAQETMRHTSLEIYAAPEKEPK